MYKADLIARVAENGGISRRDAEEAVDNVLGAISDALRDGETIQIIGFGTFGLRERAARIVRNPKTGEEIAIPPSIVPFFKAGKTLKDHVAR